MSEAATSSEPTVSLAKSSPPDAAAPSSDAAAGANTDNLVQAIYMMAADHMRAGNSTVSTENMLIEQGLSREAAQAVVANLSRMRSAAMRSAAHKNMLYGGLWCVGGIIVTAVTYSAAKGGGSYVVAWGAIAFGAIQFFRGVFQLGG